MRIAFIATQDLTYPSGLGRYWPLSKELVRLGHHVTIIALHSNYRSLTTQDKHLIRSGVHIRYVGQMHVHQVGSRKFYFNPVRLLWVTAVATARLTWTALHTPTDVYHICKPHPMNGLAGLIASRIRRKPFYLDCDDYEATSNHFSANWQKTIVSLFEDTLPRIAWGVTTNTQFMVRRLSRLGVSKDAIIYVPNAVDRSRFATISREVVKDLAKELGLQDRKVILYLGSMSLSSHALDLLLAAFGIVHQHSPEAVLLLVGGGQDYTALQEQAVASGLKDAVRFVGRVPSEQCPLYYALADVSVDPVRNDATDRARSPLKLLESLAAGIPVITSDIGDRRQLLGESPLGLLAVPHDATSLATCILQILAKPRVDRTRSAQCQNRTLPLYWDQRAAHFADVYRNAPQLRNT